MPIEAAYVIVCVPRDDGGSSVAPCESAPDGTALRPSVGRSVVLDETTANAIMAIAKPVDYHQYQKNFGFAVGTILLFWLTAVSVGVIWRTAGRVLRY